MASLSLDPETGTGLAGIGLGVPAPLDGSGFWVQRLEVAANVCNITRDARDEVIANNQRSHGGEVAELGVGEFDVPTNGSVFGIEANHVGVRGGEVEPILVHAQTAVADVVALRFSVVVPNLAAEASVHGPNVVWGGEVENAVHFEGR